VRILWLSNAVLANEESRSTGTWLHALADSLASSPDVELGNISSGDTREVVRQDFGRIQQWIVPSNLRLSADGLPPPEIVAGIAGVVKTFAPDIIHVWGTESYWGVLTAKGLLKGRVILEMQGLRSAIRKVFHGNLSLREQLGCVGIKEILRGSTIPQKRRQLRAGIVVEREVVSSHRFITVQSSWMEAQVRDVNPSATVFHNDCALRRPFDTDRAWGYSGKPTIFCSAAYPFPLKGLHVAVRALARLKPVFPSVELRIAGELKRSGLRRDGYIAWVEREARRLFVDGNISWLGPLVADDIVTELLGSSAFVLPSFIENHPLSLAEAMALGVPSVVSFAGGAPSLAFDGISALFFTPGDETMCAFQLRRAIENPVLARQLSERARETAAARNASGRILRQQVDIYRQVMNASAA
jgi:glycosyltransferase involved in cell wall biosynthesis